MNFSMEMNLISLLLGGQALLHSFAGQCWLQEKRKRILTPHCLLSHASGFAQHGGDNSRILYYWCAHRRYVLSFQSSDKLSHRRRSATNNKRRVELHSLHSLWNASHRATLRAGSSKN